MSRLAPHVIGGSKTAMSLVADGRAPAVKLVDSFKDATDYRRTNPRLWIVARATIGGDSVWRNWASDPEGYYYKFLHPHISHPANTDVDCWETGVNEDCRKLEGTEAPDVLDYRLRVWFEGHVCHLIRHIGKKSPAALCLGVGHPSGTPRQQIEAWQACLPLLKDLRDLGGYVGLHCYPLEGAGTLAGWEGPVNALLSVLKDNGLRVPYYFGECGREPGYKGDPPLESRVYAERMIAFDRIIRQSYTDCRAAFLYQFGDNDVWKNYNLDGDSEFSTPIIEYGKSTAGTVPLPPRPLINQDVFNMVLAVNPGRPVGESIPYDILQQMVAQGRRAVYSGPDPRFWGLTDSQKDNLASRMGL